MVKGEQATRIIKDEIAALKSAAVQLKNDVGEFVAGKQEMSDDERGVRLHSLVCRFTRWEKRVADLQHILRR